MAANWVAQRRLADRRVEREREVAKNQAAADATAQARIDEAELPTAARLIQGDLSVAAAHLKTMVGDDEWAEFLGLDLPNWVAEQRTLAKRLDRDDWQTVSLSALELPAMEAGWRLLFGSAKQAGGMRTMPLDPAGKPALERM